MNRTLKQILYGTFFLLVIVALGAGSYFLFVKPQATCFDNKLNQKEEGIDCGGPCTPCELKTLQLIDEEVKVFPANKLSTFLVKVSNPSPNYGLREFKYNLDVFGSLGIRLTTLTENSSILPGETKYLVIAGIDIQAKDVNTVKFNVLSYNWEKRQNLPVYDLRTDKIVTNISNLTPEVTGNLTNNSSLDFGAVKISTILFDKSGLPVNASETELDNVRAFSSTPFKVFFPKLDSVSRIDVMRTQAFAEPKND